MATKATGMKESGQTKRSRGVASDAAPAVETVPAKAPARRKPRAASAPAEATTVAAVTASEPDMAKKSGRAKRTPDKAVDVASAVETVQTKASTRRKPRSEAAPVEAAAVTAEPAPAPRAEKKTRGKKAKGFELPDYARPIEGDPEAVALATRHKDSGDPIRPYYAFLDVTPSIAKDWIHRAAAKTPLDRKSVEEKKRDMQFGRWRLNGEPIIFSDGGELLEGRSRLQACIEADTPFRALVIFNIDRNQFDTINTQRTRRLADALHIMNEPNYRSMATVLKLLWHVRNGTYDAEPGTDQDYLDLLANHHDIRESLAAADNAGRVMRLPLCAAAHYLLSRVDAKDAGMFFRALFADGRAMAGGDRKPSNSPAYRLNEWAAKRKAESERMSTVAGLAAVIYAWNHHRTGKRPKSYDWTPDMPFPEIEGWREECSLTVAAPVPDADELASAHVLATSEATKIQSWQASEGGGTAPEEGLSVRLEMVTPHKASAYLELNTANRGVQNGTVDRYARDMIAGDWGINGETVKFAAPARPGGPGRLIDGQHRLKAVPRVEEMLREAGREASVAFPMIIVRGLEEESIEAMDRGEHRDFGEVLSERGVQNAGTVAAAVRMLYMWNNVWSKGKIELPAGFRVSNSELDRVLRDNPEIAECSGYINRLRGKLLPATATLVEHKLKRIDPALATEFLDTLAHGGALVGNPILALRERLIDLYNKSRAQGSRRKGTKDGDGPRVPAAVRELSLTIRAWNMWMQGRELKVLKVGSIWEQDGSFPEPIAPSAHAPVPDRADEGRRAAML